MKDALATGYPSLDYITHVSHLPEIGETAIAYSLPENPYYGGCGANIAVALARLGFSTGLAMILGADESGDAYVEYLNTLEIDTTNIIREPGAHSSRSYLYFDPQNQHQDFFYAGAADAWDDTLALHDAVQYRYALLTVGPLRYNRQFVREVRAADVPLIWCMKPDIHAFPSSTIREFLAASTIVLMNHIEAKYVLESLGHSRLEACLSPVTQGILVTQGADGIILVTREGREHVSSLAVGEIVDPTGAGDGFAAGFVAGMLRGASLRKSAQFGAVMASFVLEKLGCQTNLPDWEEALRRYEQHYGVFDEVDNQKMGR